MVWTAYNAVYGCRHTTERIPNFAFCYFVRRRKESTHKVPHRLLTHVSHFLWRSTPCKRRLSKLSFELCGFLPEIGVEIFHRYPGSVGPASYANTEWNH